MKNFKRILSFQTDFLGAILLVGIILSSVLAVFALTPISAERLGISNSKESQILGEDIRSIEGISISLNPSSNFEIATESPITLSKKYNKLEKNDQEDRIVTITNNREEQVTYTISTEFLGNQDIISVIDSGVIIDNDKYLTSYSDSSQEQIVLLVEPSETIVLGSFIDLKNPINFSTELLINIEVK